MVHPHCSISGGSLFCSGFIGSFWCSGFKGSFWCSGFKGSFWCSGFKGSGLWGSGFESSCLYWRSTCGGAHADRRGGGGGEGRVALRHRGFGGGEAVKRPAVGGLLGVETGVETLVRQHRQISPVGVGNVA